jgi:hypothetical protein
MAFFCRQKYRVIFTSPPMVAEDKIMFGGFFLTAENLLLFSSATQNRQN